MKSLLLLSFLVSVRCSCYFTQYGTLYYCEECCFWSDGDWHCESYQYCYTFLGILLAIWLVIFAIYGFLYFNAKNKTAKRLRAIFERSQNCLNNYNQNEIPQYNNQTTEIAQINMVEFKQSNL
ncbi:unnamed protein product [Paramecium sonneborni]|uniref:Transmembrane protein n=1 Tax=Paramecium sonneborni TaxID=65129 RepID=A0A8S1QD00_9CILI|nr:unnamed protein product [Paramecium sonneborni]